MKKYLIFVFLITFSIVLGGILSPESAEKFAAVDTDTKLDVIVWMHETQNWTQERAMLESLPAGSHRKKLATQLLRENFDIAYSRISQVVSQLEHNGELEFERVLFGGFSFSAKLTKNAAELLAVCDGVREILPNEPLRARFMITHNYENLLEHEAYKALCVAPADFSIVTSSMREPALLTWHVSKIDADDAWAAGYNGTGVLITIIDTGIDYNHADLRNRMWHNSGETPSNGIDDDGNGYTDDYYGYDFYNDDGDPMDNPSDVHHGTNCAGMAVGDGSGGESTGSAPGAKVMALRIGNGTSFAGSADEASAFDYALEKGADVISMSYGSYPTSSVKNWYRYYVTNIFGSAGITVCVAAGNGNGSGGHYSAPYDISSPSDIPPPWYRAAESSPAGPVLSIGATTAADAVASFSSRGPTEWNTVTYTDYVSPNTLIKPDIAAPGALVRTTVWNSTYGYVDGTSFACPLTAGVVALLLSKNGSLTPRQIDSLLERTAKDISTSGRDNNSGAGRIDADSALGFVSGKAVSFDSVRIDDVVTGDGDRNIDPSESGRIVFYLRNSGSLLAPNVRVDVTSVSNPHIAIVDGASNFGNMAAGVSRNNTSDYVILSASALSLYGEKCMVYFTISDAEGFNHPDSFQFRIGTYPYKAMFHDTLATLLLSVTNFATVANPGGMAWPWSSDSSNVLYIGELMLSNSSSYVANGGDDFYPLDTIKLYTPGYIGDRNGFTQYIDSLNAVIVEQYSYQWRTSPNNDFIIFYMRIKNRLSSPITNLHAAFYADFDIDPYDTNYAYVDASQSWSYMYHSTSGPYFGVVNLSGYIRASAVDNPTYVYETSGMGWTDLVKWNFLTGTYSATRGTTAKDWSLMNVLGVFNLPAHDDTFVAFAIVAGSNLSDFTTNANRAKTVYASFITSLDITETDKLCPRIALNACPNPFNSSTEITIEFDEPSDFELKIFDISGRTVFSKNFAKTASSMNKIVWKPRENIDGSGVYFTKIYAQNKLYTCKLVLIR